MLKNLDSSNALVFLITSILQTIFDRVNPLPVVSFGAKESDDPAVISGSHHFEKSSFRTKQQYSDVGRFKTAQLRAVLHDSVVALLWIHLTGFSASSSEKGSLVGRSSQ